MQTVTWLVAPVWDIAETTAVTAALLRNSGDFRYVSRHIPMPFALSGPQHRLARASGLACCGCGAVRSKTPAA